MRLYYGTAMIYCNCLFVFKYICPIVLNEYILSEYICPLYLEQITGS